MKTILNVGVIGLGRIGRNHLSEIASLPDRFKIVAGADHDPERLDAMCPKELENVSKYASLDEIKKNAETEILFEPKRDCEWRAKNIKIWRRAVERSLNWVE